MDREAMTTIRASQRTREEGVHGIRPRRRVPRILCSTGVITREYTHPDHSVILRFGPDLLTDALELLVYEAWYDHLDIVERDLSKSGLSFPVVHAEKSIGSRLSASDEEERAHAIELLDANCRLANAIGADLVVLHLWGLPNGDADIEWNLSALPACCDVAERNGASLAVETIPADHGSPLAHVRRATDLDGRVLVALDTEFLAYHDELDEALRCDWLWPHVRHMHLKDYDGRLWTPEEGRRYLHPGQGDIDFLDLFRHLADRQYRGNLSLEASGVTSDGKVAIDRVQESLRLISGWRDMAWQ